MIAALAGFKCDPCAKRMKRVQEPTMMSRISFERYILLGSGTPDLTPQACYSKAVAAELCAHFQICPRDSTPNGRGAMNRCASVLSPDGKYLLVAAASSVRVYSSVTAEIVHSLYGHTQEVTAIVLHHGSNDLVRLLPYKP